MGGRYPIFDDPRVIEYVAGCMARGVKKYALKSDIESICKHRCDPDTYEKIRRKARVIIREDANREVTEFKDNAIGVLQEIVADENTAAKDKILAQKELNSILGIGHQYKQIESTEGKAKKLRDFLKATDNNIADNNIADNNIADNNIADNNIADNGDNNNITDSENVGDSSRTSREEGQT